VCGEGGVDVALAPPCFPTDDVEPAEVQVVEARISAFSRSCFNSGSHIGLPAAQLGLMCTRADSSARRR
jgi:hypothetical protein